MKEQNIPGWQKTWQSEFQTCLDVWKELKDSALAHQLSPEQKEEMEKMIQQRILISMKAAQADEEQKMTEFSRIYREELYPLDKSIHEYWKKNGYYDLRFIENGKMGLRSAKGEILLTPEHEDICFTYDDDYLFLDFFNGYGYYSVKKNGKWGIMNYQQKILLPFEYDFIFRKPQSIDEFILIKDGKQGVARMNLRRGETQVEIVVSVEMDAIYHVPGWGLILFTKNGKWGWWFGDDNDYYDHYSDPEYDNIYVQPIEEVWKTPDDDDQIFTVRTGNQYLDILYWTGK